MGLRDHIPRSRKTKIGETGRASEKRLARSLGARLRPASGAMAGAKGDMTVHKGVLLEAKSTTGDSIRLEYDWLGKIAVEAMQEGKMAVLTLSFTDKSGRAVPLGEWACVQLTALQELMGEKGGVLDCQEAS